MNEDQLGFSPNHACSHVEERVQRRVGSHIHIVKLAPVITLVGDAGIRFDVVVGKLLTNGVDSLSELAIFEGGLPSEDPEVVPGHPSAEHVSARVHNGVVLVVGVHHVIVRVLVATGRLEELHS